MGWLLFLQLIPNWHLSLDLMTWFLLMMNSVDEDRQSLTYQNGESIIIIVRLVSISLPNYCNFPSEIVNKCAAYFKSHNTTAYFENCFFKRCWHVGWKLDFKFKKSKAFLRLYRDNNNSINVSSGMQQTCSNLQSC